MNPVSHFEQSWGVSEEAEASRLRFAYGLQRAGNLATLFEGRSSPAPFRAFWFRVGYLLSQMVDDAPTPPKERNEAPRMLSDLPPPELTVSVPLSCLVPVSEIMTAVTISRPTINLTKAQFKAWQKRPHGQTLAEFLAKYEPN